MSSASYTEEFAKQDNGPSIIITCVVTTILATIFVGLRLWARRIKRMELAWDDWLLLAALPFQYAVLIVEISVVVNGGIGKHLAVNMVEDSGRLSRAEMHLFVVEFMYATAITLVKGSILCFYFQMFPTPVIKNGCYVLGSIAAGWWVAVVLVALFQCRPLYKTWTPTMTTGTCINTYQYFLGNSLANIMIDVFILALPVVAISKLQMKTFIKLGVIGAFLLGSFVIVTSGIRLHLLFALNAGGASADYTWLIAGPWVWTHVECATAIICACLPTLGPLAVKFAGSLATTTPKQSNPSASVMTIGGGGGGSRTPHSKQRKNSESGPFERLHGGNSSEEDTVGLWPKDHYQLETRAAHHGQSDPESESHAR